MLSVVYIEKICRVECRLPLNQIFVQGKVIKCPSKIAPGAFAFCQYENETNKIMFVDGLWSACRPDWQHISVQRQRYFAMEILQCQTRLDFLIVPVIPFYFCSSCTSTCATVLLARILVKLQPSIDECRHFIRQSIPHTFPRKNGQI